MTILRKTLLFFILTCLAIDGYSQIPQRIVSLSPSLTKMLYLLDAGDKLVGCTSYCEIGKNEHKAIVASAIDVSLEKVYVLKPDLIITSTITKPNTIDALRKLGLRVVQLEMTKSFDEICNQFLTIAKLIDKESLAKQIIETQRARLATLRASIKDKNHPKIFFQIGAKPLYTVFKNTFMDDYITYIGGENIAADQKIGTITRESVLVKNPDIIIIVSMGIVSDDEKGIWQQYKELSATKSGRIFTIDSDKACSPTPINFVDTVEQLIGFINK